MLRSFPFFILYKRKYEKKLKSKEFVKWTEKRCSSRILLVEAKNEKLFTMTLCKEFRRSSPSGSFWREKTPECFFKIEFVESKLLTDHCSVHDSYAALSTSFPRLTKFDLFDLHLATPVFKVLNCRRHVVPVNFKVKRQLLSITLEALA